MGRHPRPWAVPTQTSFLFLKKWSDKWEFWYSKYGMGGIWEVLVSFPLIKYGKYGRFWALEIFIKSNKTFLTFEAEYVQRKCKQAHYMLGSEGEMVQNHLHFLFFYFPQLMLNWICQSPPAVFNQYFFFFCFYKWRHKFVTSSVITKAWESFRTKGCRLRRLGHDTLFFYKKIA